MNFSIKLKELRREKGFTQEDLAEVLGVSFQTISKWENDISMPDIMMLPVVAECFDVSIDELLGYNQLQRESEIREIAKLVHEKEATGNIKEAYEFLNEKIKDYASNVKLNHLLAATAYKFAQQLEGEKKDDMLQEAIQRAELVVKLDNGNTAKTAQAKMCIAYCLRDLGVKEQAIKIAENMPSMFSSREVMLFRILEGEDKKKQAQINLSFLKELEGEIREIISE